MLHYSTQVKKFLEGGYMKLLVSDYDGTFRTNIKNLKLNIEAVNKFMEAGNKFAIATARDFNSIKGEIFKYDIKYDYLICNNGLIIFDRKNNIVSKTTIKEEDIKFIYNSFISEEKLCSSKLFDLNGLTCVVRDILEIGVKFEDKASATKYREYLEYIRANLRCDQLGKVLYIGSYSNKATAIYEIQDMENIEQEDIYTVGNSINDEEMLYEFNGFKMLKSDKELLFNGLPITRQVHTLTKKLMKSTK